MESPVRSALSPRLSLEQSDDLLKQTSRLFGSLRAEQLRDEIFDLWTRPTYWPELLSDRPCLLVGGRGTGKTTVLRALSYEGQARLSRKAGGELPFLGLYWRVDTNRVTSFEGAGLDEATWTRVFAHYVNLTMVEEVLHCLEWLRRESPEEAFHLDRRTVERIAVALLLEYPEEHHPDEARSLLRAVEDGIDRLQAFINNASGQAPPGLSLQGAPLSLLMEAVTGSPELRGKKWFFLVDEFENLLPYQQRVLNTLIKHAGDLYSFKIGMKASALRERATLNPSEQLVDPADYAYIDITERLRRQGFAEFAESVCASRLTSLSLDGQPLGVTPSALLPELSEAAEAELLGINEILQRAKPDDWEDRVPADVRQSFDQLPALDQYMVVYWAESKGSSLSELIIDRFQRPGEWSRRLNNYQHTLLYTLRSGKRGVRKHYAGWSTYLALADGNIRYLLQLVTGALQVHLQDQRDPRSGIEPSVQTQAAIDVGSRNVEELQGLSVEGASLSRLVLSLGRILGVMAAQPHGHAPEINQFRVKRLGTDDDQAAERLLHEAVMHLAVVRFPGDKNARLSGETKADDYMLHPIFAPVFTFSYRRKRRMVLSSRDVVELTRTPSRTIPDVLRRTERDSGEELPPQLQMFEDYFNAAN